MCNTRRATILALAAVLCIAAQAQEIEPNNPCEAAQDVGSPGLPVSLFGALTPTAESPDVDFFRFAVEPGLFVRVDLEGAPTGQGTLGDPYLGLFDAACNLVAINDDSGTLNSRLIFASPDDGIVILGVTACCDGGFTGVGEGSYRLSIARLAAIESIAGRIVSSDTGQPLPGSEFPFASAQLIRCEDFGCFEFVGFQQADGDGRFLFANDFAGNPLTVGSYEIQVSASGFERFFSGPFSVAEGEPADLGDLPLVPFQLIGSVSGRVIDAVTGDPVTGFGPPFAVVFLERCDSGFCFAVAGASPDTDGRFDFNGAQFFIPPGTFRLRGFAEDYRESVSSEFAVDAFQHVDVGDFRLTPFPIRFGAVQECQIPPGGGLCEFGIAVSNRGPGRYRGEAWSTVDLFTPGASRNSRFQVGKVGTTNPMPQRLNLGQGKSAMLSFQLDVPTSVLDGTTICATIAVGRDPNPQFSTQGDRFVFCSVKVAGGGFEALSGKEGRRIYRESIGKPTGATQFRDR